MRAKVTDSAAVRVRGGKATSGSYDPRENVLHLWFPDPVRLNDEGSIQSFFDEVLHDWIRPCPTKPYLLVNYANLHVRPDMVDSYAKAIGRFRDLVRGTFRYGISADATGQFTAVAVRLGNLRLSAPTNIYASEQEARHAIQRAKSKAAGA